MTKPFAVLLSSTAVTVIAIRPSPNIKPEYMVYFSLNLQGLVYNVYIASWIIHLD